ncbi:MAG: hypothetical protein A2254_04385 [Ignavibacteria bacterium RIFOXYA2_FULL_35_9]|nr:MAG: hypothetical protein A2254_04385 [Ignavibacteria bacterium RIFOXYA2_FULL_35_9]
MKILLLRSVLLIALFMLSSFSSYSQNGWWKFDNPANLTTAEPGYGSDQSKRIFITAPLSFC